MTICAKNCSASSKSQDGVNQPRVREALARLARQTGLRRTLEHQWAPDRDMQTRTGNENDVTSRSVAQSLRRNNRSTRL